MPYFRGTMIPVNLTSAELKLKHEAGKAYVFDPIRKGWYILTPEEHVRQYLFHHLINNLQYPVGMMAAEKRIVVGNMNKRFDIAVYDREHKPWMLIECKAPEIELTEKTLHQLLNYQRKIQCRYLAMCNGRYLFCADGENIEQVSWLKELPTYNL